MSSNDANDENEKLLDPSYMDGPIVKHTVADLFDKHPKLGMTYHVMGSGYDYMTPLFGLIGTALYPIYKPFGAMTLLQQVGNFGVMGGAFGMSAGAFAISRVASKGEHQKRPWNDEGIEDRWRGVQHNFRVRAMDRSVWIGIAAAAGTLAVAGGPTALKLAPGTRGVLQALSIGSAAGSLAGVGYVQYSTRE